MKVVFKGEELRELLRRSVLALDGADFYLSTQIRMEDAMMALDLENPRMDRALLSIHSTPLFEFHPPLPNYSSKDHLNRFLQYTLQSLCTWFAGEVNLAESLLTIAPFYLGCNTLNTQSINPPCVYYFVLGVWRLVDMVNDLVCVCEVVKREEFYSGNCRIPKDAGKGKNGLAISHLQELESADPLLRLLKLLIMLFTGFHLGQPMDVLKETIIAPLRLTLSKINTTSTSSELSEGELEEIGVYPLLCNLVTVGCPKTNVKKPMTMESTIQLLYAFLDDLEYDGVADVRWLMSFPFRTVLGRAVYAFYQQRRSTMNFYNDSVDSYCSWRIIGMLLHSPSRQWRLLTKYLEFDDSNDLLCEHWAKLGRMLGLFEPDELVVTDSRMLLQLFKSRRR